MTTGKKPTQPKKISKTEAAQYQCAENMCAINNEMWLKMEQGQVIVITEEGKKFFKTVVSTREALLEILNTMDVLSQETREMIINLTTLPPMIFICLEIVEEWTMTGNMLCAHGDTSIFRYKYNDTLCVIIVFEDEKKTPRCTYRFAKNANELKEIMKNTKVENDYDTICFKMNWTPIKQSP